MSADEAQAYLHELGLESSGLGRLIRAGYQLLDLITFFTTVGGKIVRAWTLPRGHTVLEAAGQIHSDMQRGFIRAEVMHYDDLARVWDRSPRRASMAWCTSRGEITSSRMAISFTSVLTSNSDIRLPRHMPLVAGLEPFSVSKIVSLALSSRQSAAKEEPMPSIAVLDIVIVLSPEGA